jgi:lysophospholipase L1-like esterase
VEIINTGIGNYNTVQEVLFFEKYGLGWQPDLVILNYFINDAEPVPQRRAAGVFKQSYLAMWLWGRFDTLSRMAGKKAGFGAYYENLYREDRPGWQEAKRAMKRLIDLGRKHHFSLGFAILPELHGVGPRYAFQEIHDKLAFFLNDQGAEWVLDVAPYFRNEVPHNLWVSPDDAHPNARAHAVIANALFQQINI